jgi:hypothetical protein
MALGLTLLGALAADPATAAGLAGSASMVEGSTAAPSGEELRLQEDPSVPHLEAARRQGQVTVDGSLDEEAWERTPVATGFVQGEPEEGAEPAQPTEVRILFDGEAIYVGARMHEPSAGTVADQLVRRDEDGQYDYLEVGFDPNLDQQTAYVFRVGASGVERDAFIVEGSGGFGDDGGGVSIQSTEAPVETETQAAADTPAATETPAPTEAPQETATEVAADTTTPTPTEIVTEADGGGALDLPALIDGLLGGGFPPGLAFFLGGATVLTVLVALTYVRTRS